MTSVETSHGDASSAEFSFGDGKTLGWEVMATKPGDERDQALIALRAAFRNLSDSKAPGAQRSRQEIDQAYARNNPGSTDVTRVSVINGQATSHKIRTVERCAESDLLSLEKFVYDNNQRLLKQARSLQQSEGRIRAKILKGVDRLSGTVSKNIKHDYNRAIKAVGGLKSIDDFEAGGLIADGYYLCREDEQSGIYLPNLFNHRREARGLGPRLLETVFHEYTHATGDVNDEGFSKGVVSPRENNYLRLLEEPAVEYLTRIAMGKPSESAVTLNTNTLSGGKAIRGPYGHEQMLLDWLEVPADQLREAFFAPYGEDYSIARRGLLRHLNKAAIKNFPELKDDGFHGLATAYEDAQDRDSLVASWISRVAGGNDNATR